MRKLFSWFILKKEAILLDSMLYIIKSFFAVAAAFYIAHNNPILKLDTISVLFGLMLTLEPVTLTGIKNGFDQLYATLLGAASTAIIIYFIGINVFSIALSVAFTLYVCLKIDWRAVSPVAIFTSIYMTQYVQNTSAGVPSILLTFRLRMYALTTGVIIAILLNFLFSVFSYRSMLFKRIAFLVDSIIENLKMTKEGIENSDSKLVISVKNSLPHTFNNIDWVFSLFNDIRKESFLKINLSGFSKKDMEKFSNVLLFLRSITHLNYDVNYILLEENFQWLRLDNDRNKILNEMEQIINKLISVKNIFENKKISLKDFNKIRDTKSVDGYRIVKEEHYLRLLHDLKEMNRNIRNMNTEIENIESLSGERTGLNSKVS